MLYSVDRNMFTPLLLPVFSTCFVLYIGSSSSVASAICSMKLLGGLEIGISHYFMVNLMSSQFSMEVTISMKISTGMFSCFIKWSPKLAFALSSTLSKKYVMEKGTITKLLGFYLDHFLVTPEASWCMESAFFIWLWCRECTSWLHLVQRYTKGQYWN